MSSYIVEKESCARPALLALYPTNLMDVTPIKEKFKETARVINSLAIAFTEIQNDALYPLKIQDQEIFPGMSALFGATYMGEIVPHQIKVFEHPSLIGMGDTEITYPLFPKYLERYNYKGGFFVRANKDITFAIKGMDKPLVQEIYNLFQEFDKFKNANMNSEEVEPMRHPLYNDHLFQEYWRDQRECKDKLEGYLYLSKFSITEITL